MLSAATRRKAIEAGTWVRANGEHVRIRVMGTEHLVNALLQVLAAGESQAIWEPLAREVDRRRLRKYAIDVARHRMGIDSHDRF